MPRVSYRADIAHRYGSVYAGILVPCLEWYFAQKPDGFYKFLGPCSHPMYRPGDSWAEELAFSRHQFRVTFALIGMAYPSIGEYKAAPDPFNGRPYASYYDRGTGLTIYIRNAPVAEGILGKSITKPQKPKAKPEKTKPKPQKPKTKAAKTKTSNNPIQAAHNEAIRLWDEHLKSTAGISVTAVWESEGGKEAKAMQAILRQLSDFVDRRREQAPSSVEPDQKAAILQAWGYLLKAYPNWQPFHQKPRLSFINQYLPEIITHLRNGKSQPKAANLANEVSQLIDEL